MYINTCASLPAEMAVVNKTKFIVVINRAQQLQQSRHAQDINRRFLVYICMLHVLSFKYTCVNICAYVCMYMCMHEYIYICT